MNFQPSEDQAQLRETARRFARNELRALADALEQSNTPVPLEWRRRYAEMGFLGINLPEEYGGLGLGHVEALLVLEEFAKVSPAVAFPVFESATGPVRAISHFAPAPLRERLIPKVVSGEMVVAVAMSEPDAGTALTDLATRGRIDGDKIEISGQKRWCSGAGHSDAYVVYCRMSDEPGAAGIGAVLVEKDTPGLAFGKQEALMGFRGIPSADMFLDDVRVPAGNLIVGPGGFKRLMEVFDLERCGNATMSLGIAASALEEAVEYVGERRQFGKPIAEFQAVQLKLAEMAMKVEAARLLIWRAASDAQAGLPSQVDSSLAKCFANEMVREVSTLGMQLMGGYGYSKAFAMERRVRDAFGWGIAAGTIDIQKINIASALLGRRFNQRA